MHIHIYIADRGSWHYSKLIAPHTKGNVPTRGETIK
jgi:hypothetical protein